MPVLCQLSVQLDPVHHHPGEADARPQLTDQPGRVERRPARELGAVQEQDVAPAHPRQVVRDAGAGDAAAHDHDARAVVAHVAIGRDACSSHTSKRSSAIERDRRSKRCSAYAT